MPEFDEFFDALRSDANDVPPLAYPGELRRIGDRRTRRYRLAGAGALAVLVIAATASVPLLRPAGSSTPPGGATATSTAPSTEPNPGPSASLSPPAEASTPPPTSSAEAAAECRPGDLDPRPYYLTEGAAGTVYRAVYVSNASAKPCQLSEYPVLYYTTAAGKVQ